MWDNINDFYYNDSWRLHCGGVRRPGAFTTSQCSEDPLPLTLDIPNVQTICLGGTANLGELTPRPFECLDVRVGQWVAQRPGSTSLA